MCGMFNRLNDIGTHMTTLKMGTTVVIGDILNKKLFKLHFLPEKFISMAWIRAL